MPGAAGGDGNAFALDGADGCRGEGAERVGANEDGVAGVDDSLGCCELLNLVLRGIWSQQGRRKLLTVLDDSRYDGAHEGDGKGVVDMELEGRVGVVVAVVGEDVKKLAHEVEALAGDV